MPVEDYHVVKTVLLPTSAKHSNSKATTLPDEHPTQPAGLGHSRSPSIPSKGNLSSLQTSPFDLPPESSTFSPRWQDRGSSVAGDAQSLTSSSVMHIPSSILSGQMNTSASRRTNKKVSFYEEPRSLVLTTTTYV